MRLSIEMTPRGVLLAGGWRTAEELERKSSDDIRNVLIVDLTKHTNQSAAYFQGFDDGALVGKGATAVFLEKAGIRGGDALKTMSDDDERNTLIVENAHHAGLTGPQLQGMSDRELVKVGLEWFAESSAKEWMKRKWETIKDRRLWQIAIPGTHDSGCYGECWQGIVHHAALAFNPRSRTQTASIQGQLDLGIRTFDLRFEKHGNEYYIFHGPDVFNVALGDVLKDIKRFLGETEKEILILQFCSNGEPCHREVLGELGHTGMDALLSKDDVTNLGRNWPANCTPERLIGINKRVILLWDQVGAMTYGRGEVETSRYIWSSAKGTEYVQTTRPGNFPSAYNTRELIEGRGRDLEWWRSNCRDVYFAHSGRYWFGVGMHLTTNMGDLDRPLEPLQYDLQTLAEESLPKILEKLRNEWKNGPWNLIGADLFGKEQYLDFTEAVVDLNDSNNFPYAIPDGQ